MLALRLCVVTALLSVPSVLLAQTVPMDMTVEDQREKKHSLKSFFKDKPVVIIAGAARDTPDAMEKWMKALKASKVGGKVVLLGLSNLDPVPFFIPNSSIRSSLTEQFPKDTVICDWDAVLYNKLKFPEDGVIAVTVFDAKGNKVAGAAREHNKGDEMHLVRTITQMLEPPGDEAAPAAEK